MTGLCILLLDDNADTLRLTCEMLAADGYTAYGCSTCEHATRMALLVRPGVILLHSCDRPEHEAFHALLMAAPHIPLVHYCIADGSYAVFRATGKRTGYVPASSGYRTITSAIRAAVVESLESV